MVVRCSLLLLKTFSPAESKLKIISNSLPLICRSFPELQGHPQWNDGGIRSAAAVTVCRKGKREKITGKRRKI